MSILVAILVAGLLGAAAVPVPAAPAQPDSAAFRAWFERESQHPTTLSPSAVKAARAYRYVFIAGFLNEGFQIGYFNQNRQTLLDAGVK
ncbi:MAG TPA: hypothetical protein VHU40_20380, partial [Polyangia bacterium]|nr:hypothetical protein [Polyangia bacterium]